MMNKQAILTISIIFCCFGNLLEAQKDTSFKTNTKQSPITIKKRLFKPEADTLDAVTVHANRTNNQKPLTIGRVAIPPMDLPQAVSVVNRYVTVSYTHLTLPTIA